MVMAGSWLHADVQPTGAHPHPRPETAGVIGPVDVVCSSKAMGTVQIPVTTCGGHIKTYATSEDVKNADRGIGPMGAWLPSTMSMSVTTIVRLVFSGSQEDVSFCCHGVVQVEPDKPLILDTSPSQPPTSLQVPSQSPQRHQHPSVLAPCPHQQPQRPRSSSVYTHPHRTHHQHQ